MMNSGRPARTNEASHLFSRGEYTRLCFSGYTYLFQRHLSLSLFRFNICDIFTLPLAPSFHLVTTLSLLDVDA